MSIKRVQDYTEFCIYRDTFLFFYSLIIWLLELVTLKQSTFDYNQSSALQSPVADLEGGVRPPPKIRKAYVIQRLLSSSTNNFFMNG